MTTATDTSLGTITLTGDLDGSATTPILRASGVLPGAYFPASLVVNQKGLVIDCVNDVLNFPMPCTTTSTCGFPIIGPNISVSSGTISIPPATTSSLGVISVNTFSGLVSTSGAISINYSVLSQRLVNATTSNYGMVEISTNHGIDVDNGIISINETYIQNNFAKLASTSQTGLVQIGNGISVNTGVISADMSYIDNHIPIATNSVQGIFSVPNNNTGLVVSAGIVSTIAADGTGTYGVVASADSTLISIVNGKMDVGVNVLQCNAHNVWPTVIGSTSNRGGVNDLSSTPYDIVTFTLSSNITFDPRIGTYPVGMLVRALFVQDATGGRTVAFPGGMKFNDSTSINTAANSSSLLTILYISNSVALCYIQQL